MKFTGKPYLRLGLVSGLFLLFALFGGGASLQAAPSAAKLSAPTDIDLITNIDSVEDVVQPGGSNAYTVTVENRGPSTAINADWVVEVSSAATISNIVCTSSGGATCPATFTQQTNVAVEGFTAVIPSMPIDSLITVTFDTDAKTLTGNYSADSTVTPNGQTDAQPETNDADINISILSNYLSWGVEKSILRYEDEEGTEVGAPSSGHFVYYEVVVTNNGIDDINDLSMTETMGVDEGTGSIATLLTGTTVSGYEKDFYASGTSITDITCTAQNGATCPADETYSTQTLKEGIDIPFLPGRTRGALTDAGSYPESSVTFEVRALIGEIACSSVAETTRTILNRASLSSQTASQESETGDLGAPYGPGDSSDNSAEITFDVFAPACPSYDIVTQITETAAQAADGIDEAGAYTYTVTVSNSGPDTVFDMPFFVGTHFLSAGASGFSTGTRLHPDYWANLWTIDNIACAPAGGGVCPAAYSTTSPQEVNIVDSGGNPIPDGYQATGSHDLPHSTAIIPSLPSGGTLTFTVTGTSGELDLVCGIPQYVNIHAHALPLDQLGETNIDIPSVAFESYYLRSANGWPGGNTTHGAYYGNNGFSLRTQWNTGETGGYCDGDDYDLSVTMTGPFADNVDVEPGDALAGSLPADTVVYYRVRVTNIDDGGAPGGIDFIDDRTALTGGFMAGLQLVMDPFGDVDWLDLNGEFGLGTELPDHYNPLDETPGTTLDHPVGYYPGYSPEAEETSLPWDAWADVGFECFSTGGGAECPDDDDLTDYYANFDTVNELGLAGNRGRWGISTDWNQGYWLPLEDFDGDSLHLPEGSNIDFIIPYKTPALTKPCVPGGDVFTYPAGIFFQASVSGTIPSAYSGVISERDAGNNASSLSFQMEVPDCAASLEIDKRTVVPIANDVVPADGIVRYEIDLTYPASAANALDVARFTDIPGLDCGGPSYAPNPEICADYNVINVVGCVVTSGNAVCPADIPIGEQLAQDGTLTPIEAGTIDTRWGTPSATDLAGGAAFEPDSSITITLEAQLTNVDRNLSEVRNTAAFASDPDASIFASGMYVEDTELLAVENVDLMTLQKAVGPTDANAGDTITFTLDLINNGPADGQGAYVTDTVPANLLVDNPAGYTNIQCAPLTTAPPLATGPNTADCANVTITNNGAAGFQIDMAGSWQMNSGYRITFEAIAPLDGTSVENTAILVPPPPSATQKFTGVADSTVNFRTPSAFDLALRKTLVTAGTITRGQDVTFQIEVFNQGTAEATSIEVTDYYSADLAYSSSNAVTVTSTEGGANVTITDDAGTFTIDSLPADDSVIFEVTTTLSATFVGTTLDNFAEISAADNDADDGNTPPTDVDSTPDATNGNGDGESTNIVDDEILEDANTDGDEDDHDFARITLDALVPAIQIVKTAGTAADGETLTTAAGDVEYTYVVTNTGNTYLSDITITDDAGTAGDAADDVTLTNADCADLAGPLAPDDSVTCTYTFNIADNTTNIADTTGNPVLEDGTDIDGLTDPTDSDDAVVEVETHSIGNQVWEDANNNGMVDSGEAALEGVAVELWQDANGDGEPDDINTDGVVDDNDRLDTATTDSDGYYLFDGLSAGDYLVVIPASEWDDAGALAGYASSTGNSADDVDNNDNGIDPDTIGDAVYSATVTLGDGEPTEEDPDNDATTPDGNENLTVDFGFYYNFDLALTKELIDESPYEPTDSVTFRVSVINQGSVDAFNIEVTDYIPDGLALSLFEAPFSDLSIDTDTGVVTIAELLVGATKTYDLTFTIEADFQGASLVNWAEISSADDDDDAGNTAPVDIDSTPDAENQNTDGETDGVFVDDAVDGDGKNGGDEDDHDPATVVVGQVFDLALRKDVVSTGDIAAGDDVVFSITIENQGSLDAYDIDIVDYIPSEMDYVSSNATDVTTTEEGADITVTDNGVSGELLELSLDALAAGDSVVVEVTLSIDADFTGSSLVNWAEIAAADDDEDPDNDAPTDVDSTPDSENQNTDGETDDVLIDNATNQDGKDGGDEDDHDPATVTLTDAFDLALIKQVKENQTLLPGGDVVFTIEVLNQGEVDAYAIEVTEYPQAGLTFKSINASNVTTTSDGNAVVVTDSGSGAFSIDTLAADDSVTVEVTMTLANDASGTVSNYAEISAADDDEDADNDAPVDIDSTPDSENQNTDGEDANLVDDSVSENGKDGGDEDDHDVATVTLTALAEIGDYVWYDTNYNGIQEDGEAAVEGVTVNLYDEDDSQVATTITNSNGEYGFTDLQPGIYYLEFDLTTLPTGFEPTRQNEGSDDALDSDADPTTGRTIRTTLDVGESDQSWDMGIYQAVTIGDFVWFDTDADGLQDDDEPVMTDVTVRLLDEDGNVLDETTTNNSGVYEFADILPGDYIVEFVPPAGHGFTLQEEGLDSGIDSDVDRATGRSRLVSLATGSSNLTVDAGMASGQVLAAIEAEVASRSASLNTTNTPVPTAVPVPTATAVPISPVASSLKVNKSASNSIGRPGDLITYTIVVENPNTVAINGVVIIDQLSSKLDYISATSTKGVVNFDAPTQTVRVTVGETVGNETVTVTIQARVNNTASAPDNIPNTAQVLSDGFPALNSLSASLQIIPNQIPTTGIYSVTPGAMVVYAIVLLLVLANLATAVILQRKFN